MLINQKTKVATEEERFIDAFDQLDSITRQALMINLRAMAAGDSMREALNKALAFLSGLISIVLGVRFFYSWTPSSKLLAICFNLMHLF